MTVEEFPRAPSPEILARALRDRPGFFFLDSAQPEADSGRAFSFVGFAPFLTWQATGDQIAIETAGTRIELNQEPLGHLRTLMQRYHFTGSGEIPFAGGAVGYFGYEFGARAEGVRAPTPDAPSIPEARFGFYDGVIACDHAAGKTFLIAQPVASDSAGTILARLRAAVRDAANQTKPGLSSQTDDEARNQVERVDPNALDRDTSPNCALGSTRSTPKDASALAANLSREDYLQRVERIKAYIAAGDVYQVNLAQRFELATAEPPYAVYERLRALSPAPFGAYLDAGDFQLLSCSPELFLRLDASGRALTRPIKGTRRRGKTADEDRRLAAELWASEKDQAELLMIVDLERNDLGRVCRFGSVRVEERHRIEPHPTVFHLVATISGQLSNGHDVFDCLRALLPGGSITGAPKIRAMQIIAELEPGRRDVYTGAIGYLGFDGTCDFNIAIRTLLFHAGRASYQVGGGIVADSEPETEYQETLTKGRAMRAALLGESLPRAQGFDGSRAADLNGGLASPRAADRGNAPRPETETAPASAAAFMPTAWYNGALAATAALKIPALDPGFMLGNGLFETVRVHDAQPLRLAAHHARLTASAAVLGAAPVASWTEFQVRCQEVIAANRQPHGSLKILLFRGGGRWSELILARTATYAPERYARGFHLMTASTARRTDQRYSLKSLDYRANLEARQLALAAGCDEALFIDPRGLVLEGATTNVFVVKKGVVSTPGLGCLILPGVMRADIIAQLAPAGLSERAVSLEELLAADEVFVTNALLGVMPVARVDGTLFPLDRNPVTRSLMAKL